MGLCTLQLQLLSLNVNVKSLIGPAGIPIECALMILRVCDRDQHAATGMMVDLGIKTMHELFEETGGLGDDVFLKRVQEERLKVHGKPP